MTMAILAHVLKAADQLEAFGRLESERFASARAVIVPFQDGSIAADIRAMFGRGDDAGSRNTACAARAARAKRIKSVAQSAASSDEVLIEQIAKGDQAALRALMGRHQARVSRFILRFVDDRNLVEDLVCDTFFAAWQQAPHFERRSTVATWLLAIARYKALSARERRTIPTEPLDDVAAATLVDSSPRPDTLIEREDQARLLRRCLAALPAEQAVLIDLVYYRDKSVKEAALLTGIPENTVKSRMFLARKKLAAMLTAADAESETVTLVPTEAPAEADVAREEPRKTARAETAARRLALT
jgi:RNA polymerase sigma-70 factor (ECF subfamily)